MRSQLLLLALLPATALATEPEAPAQEPTAEAEAPQLDPAVVTWYQDMRLACTDKRQAIELAQGQTDTAWRAWQAEPAEEQRASLVQQLEGLQRLCGSVE